MRVFLTGLFFAVAAHAIDWDKIAKSIKHFFAFSSRRNILNDEQFTRVFLFRTNAAFRVVLASRDKDKCKKALQHGNSIQEQLELLFMIKIYFS